jgi:hypothetical protein
MGRQIDGWIGWVGRWMNRMDNRMDRLVVDTTTTWLYHYSFLYDEMHRMEIGEGTDHLAMMIMMMRGIITVLMIKMMSMYFIADNIMMCSGE